MKDQLMTVLPNAKTDVDKQSSVAIQPNAGESHVTESEGLSSRPRRSNDEVVQLGMASWYGKPFHGRRTANGERFNMYALTAAHRTLPLGTHVRVTHLVSGRSVLVRINDRGPYVRDRIIDLSMAAAEKLDLSRTGTAQVMIKSVSMPDGLRKAIVIQENNEWKRE
ncbi:septal ring lytic transglycosylase RlpA family protein [Burkholderia ambifaria]|uniref:septal ring lytic transglycosylase RlpA family protein n=1 Tax=Burkholderia ambifaria TaxID=152480 RepID=UPI001FC8C075|nr:septal ring lytic transglycosylase RlpA family protein [Burkholderia ambifaria]